MHAQPDSIAVDEALENDPTAEERVSFGFEIHTTEEGHNSGRTYHISGRLTAVLALPDLELNC